MQLFFDVWRARTWESKETSYWNAVGENNAKKTGFQKFFSRRAEPSNSYLDVHTVTKSSYKQKKCLKNISHGGTILCCGKLATTGMVHLGALPTVTFFIVFQTVFRRGTLCYPRYLFLNLLEGHIRNHVTQNDPWILYSRTGSLKSCPLQGHAKVKMTKWQRGLKYGECE